MAVFGWRWPTGVVYPVCSGREHSRVRTLPISISATSSW